MRRMFEQNWKYLIFKTLFSTLLTDHRPFGGRGGQTGQVCVFDGIGTREVPVHPYLEGNHGAKDDGSPARSGTAAISGDAGEDLAALV